MEQSSQPKPKPQSILALIAVNRVGSKIGNESMAVRVELLFVFDAMAEVKVSVEDMEKAPSVKTQKNSRLFSTGLPINR